MKNPDRPKMKLNEAAVPPTQQVFVRRRASSPPEWLKSIPKGSKLVSITFPDHPEMNVLPEASVPPVPPSKLRI